MGVPFLAAPSSTCVAQITGTCAASQIHNISSWISASLTQPHSIARSPRAIIIPAGYRRMIASNICGSALNARFVSIFATIGSS